MAFDAGTIVARLEIDQTKADAQLRDFERKVGNAERQRLIKLGVSPQEAQQMRRQMEQLDRQLTQDAMRRSQSGQGSVLGTLMGLSSPAAARAQATQQASAQRSFLDRLAKTFSGGGGSGGGSSALAGLFSGGGGGGGNQGLGTGLFKGIGPGVLGIGARVGTIGALGGLALGGLPALLGGAAPLGVAGVGVGALGLLFKQASSQVSPLLQLQNQIQQAQLTAATPQQKQALAAQTASLNQAVSQLPKAQRQMYTAMSQIQNAWQNFGQSFAPVLAKGLGAAAKLFQQLMPMLHTFFADATTLIGPLVAGLGDLAKNILPPLGAAFKAAAPFIRPLIDGLARLAGGLLAGLVPLLKAASPAVKVLAAGLALIGRDIGQMFKDFAPVMKASSVILLALLKVVAALFPIIGSLAAVFARDLAPVVKAFGAAIIALLPFLQIVGKVLASLAAAILGDLASAFLALARLLVLISPSLKILANALSQVFKILENTGVFASFGSALEAIVPSLAQMINLIVRQLAPFLPTLIVLFAKFSTILIDLVAAGLATILRGVTAMIAHFPVLVPIIAALTVAWLAWNLVMSANPIGLIIVAIAALVGAVTLLVTHWHRVWTDIKNWAMDAWNFLTHGWGQFLVPGLTAIRLAVQFVHDHWKQAWDDIKAVGLDAWHIIDQYIVQPLERVFLHDIPGAFSSAVRFIGSAWDAIKGVVEAPIKFVIDNVVDGLISAFDWISGKVGGPHIAPVHPFGLRQGGRLPGWGGGDIVPALLEPGEAVVSKEHAAAYGWLFKMMGVPGFQRGSGGPIGARVGPAASPSNFHGSTGGIGGLLHDVTGAGKILAALATGNTTALVNALNGMLPKGVGGAVGDLASLLKSGVSTLVHAAVHFLLGSFGGGGVPGTPGNVLSYRPDILRALQMLGQPAADLGVVLRQMTTESGGNPTIVNKWDSNWLAGTPSVGLMQVIGPTFAAYAGAFRNTGPFEYGVSVNPLANIYAGLHYAISRYGGGWTSVLGQGHGYDGGGWWPTGTAGFNTSGQPEAVLTKPQWAALASGGDNGDLIAEIRAQTDALGDLLGWLPDAVGASLGDVLNGVAQGAVRRAHYGAR